MSTTTNATIAAYDFLARRRTESALDLDAYLRAEVAPEAHEATRARILSILEERARHQRAMRTYTPPKKTAS